MAVTTCLGSTFPIVVWWGRELILIYNDPYIAILGNKHPRALGRPGVECWREVWPLVGPMLERVLDEGKPFTADDLQLMVWRDGYFEECFFCFSYGPIYEMDGTVSGVFCPVIETTDKIIGARRLETLRELAALRRAESVGEACQQAIAILAKNDRDIPFASLYLLSGDGRSAALMGSTAGPRDGRELPLEQITEWNLAEALTEPRLLEDPAGKILPTGHWPEPPRQIYLAPVILPGSQAPRAILVVGISPHKRFDTSYRSFAELLVAQVGATLADTLAYESERKRAQALEEIDRAKTVFFSNISHEFRTPLTLMLGPLKEALSDASLSPAERDRLEIARRNALRLLKLVNSLLDFSRIEAGRAQASYEPTDLASLTVDLASNFRAACEVAGLSLVVDCPPLDDPVYVDREMFEKVVLNLISNAFKFTLEGEIRVMLRREGGFAVLSVRDTGIGISEAEQPRLFERFHRVENARGRTYEGSGIGLALVRELVGLHRGVIEVASAEGKGSTFAVRLPFGRSHLPVERIATPRILASTTSRAAVFVDEALRWLPDTAVEGSTDARSPATSSPRGFQQGGRIVVADDNADMREYLRQLLAPHYTVELVANGRQALEAVQRRHPDLVLSDVMMPEMDGFNFLKTLRADPHTRHLPIILLSARAGEEAKIEGLDADADDYLIKPFSARELLARIATKLEMARLRLLANEREILMREILISELQHRTRNLLTVIGGIADQTLATSSSLDEFGTRFEERLAAIGRVQGLLSRNVHPDVSIGELIRHELSAHGLDLDGNRVVLAGEQVSLPPCTIQLLALAVHELLTNAVKHGALSRPEGSIAIGWAVETDHGGSRLRLTWRERGVLLERAAGSRARGFGLDLLENLLPFELDARTSVKFADDGLEVEISLPFAAERETVASPRSVYDFP